MNTSHSAIKVAPERLFSGASRNPRTTFAWITWLMLLLIVMMGTLVMYLRSFEMEENQRQQTADGQWLEQSVLFHFRRLEEDLRSRVAQGLSASGAPSRQGLLMSTTGVVQNILWIPEGHLEQTQALKGYSQALRVDSFDLSIMLDIAKELQRAAYAPEAVPGKPSEVWVAVPVLDQRAQFSGHVVASLQMEQAIAAMVPAWFSSANKVKLSFDAGSKLPDNPAGPPNQYRVYINLPGFDFALDVEDGGAPAPWAPRLLTAAALVALIGMLLSLYVLRQDLRKRQQVQAALHDEMALRQAMENSVTTGLRAWDMEGRIIYVNQAFCDMVGYSEAELLGKRAPLPYWPLHQINEIEAMHRNIRKSGTSDQGLEVTFQHRNGNMVDVLVHEAPLYSADGEQWGWMSSVLDISERKRMEKVAQQQQRQLEASGRLMAVGEVASTLAHELNQPLGALSGFATGLLNRLEKQDIALQDVRPVVSRIQQMADRAGNIIRRINAFARKREMQQEHIHLPGLIKQRLQPSFNLRDLTWKLPDAAVWVLGDSTLLEHAFRNLTQNALDWSHPLPARATRVCVTVQIRGDFVELRFEDNGPGVAESERDQIFDAFYTRKDGGMGMGLSIVRSVIEAHRGSIDVVRSELLGGACFVIRLPIES